MAMKNATSIITLRITPELKDKLQSVADKEGKSLNALLTEMVEEKSESIKEYKEMEKTYKISEMRPANIQEFKRYLEINEANAKTMKAVDLKVYEIGEDDDTLTDITDTASKNLLYDLEDDWAERAFNEVWISWDEKIFEVMRGAKYYVIGEIRA